MASHKDHQSLYDRIAALREQVTDRLGADLISNPQLADALTKQIDDMLKSVVENDAKTPPPPDQGLASLIGVGPEAAKELGTTRIPPGVEPYDETITSERIMAVGDMYYLWQHEKIGVFRAVQKLQELFKAGTVRLSAGPGAFALYQFDRRDVLRYTKKDRLSAYKRIFGYGGVPVPTGSRANSDFHKLFSHFVHQVTLFWRDKRISDVIRERAYDPSFGSIAIVRRAGLAQQSQMAVLRPSECAARRSDATTGRSLQDSQLARRQAAVRRGQLVGCVGGGVDPLPQRAPGYVTASAHGSYGT